MAETKEILGVDMEAMYVVIATAGRDTLLTRTLDSLVACRKPTSYERLIVIENGVPGEAEQCVRDRAGVLSADYLYFAEGNKSKALNYALQHLEDGLVVFFDDDVQFQPDVLVAYEKAARQNGHAFFGGPVSVDQERPPPDWLKRYLPGSAIGWGHQGLACEKSSWFLGLNWAARVQHLKAVGGFDVNLGPGTSAGMGEETKMQERLLAAGYENVLVPKAIVRHHVPLSNYSAKWALRRVYRNGVVRGHEYAMTVSRRPGASRWMWLMALKNGFNLLKAGVRFDRKAAFHSTYHLVNQIGSVKGYNRARNLRVPPDQQKSE